MSNIEAETRVPRGAVPDGGVIRVQVGPHDVALFRRREEFFAVSAICPHRRGPLDTDGIGADYLAYCPWHGWSFDVRTGRSPYNPGRVACFAVEADGEELRVRAPACGTPPNST